jgi:chaperonin GroEL
LTVEESTSVDSTLELKQGMQFDKGMISPYFIDQGNKHGEANLGDTKTPVRILVTDMHIRDLEEFHEMLQRLIEGAVLNSLPLLLVALKFRWPATLSKTTWRRIQRRTDRGPGIW